MTVAECYKYIQEGLNKLNSNSSQNVTKSSFVSTFNAVQLQWVEDRIKLAELNKIRTDELQQLVTQVTLPVKKDSLYYTSNLPTNYFHYIRSTGNKGCSYAIWLVKEADVNVLLNDAFYTPSVEWGETFCTLGNGQLKTYHNDVISLDSVDIIYYRYPRSINMDDGYDDVNGQPTVDVDPEFQGSSLIEILNLCIQHISGVVNDQLRYQVFTNKSQVHT